jgi:cyclohexanone monooxygenase
MAVSSKNIPVLSQSSRAKYDVVIVGAGFAGMYMLHLAKKQGFSAVVLEAASGVGGTWYWNRYPGARCDVESMQYSYSFSEELQQAWSWTEKYASQPEILEYANYVAEKFDLLTDIQLNRRVKRMSFRSDLKDWSVETDNGDIYESQYCVMATGCLSAAQVPDIPGLAEFDGLVLHTGKWPHEAIDFHGKRVGVIGTGSSGIQVIPELARQAKELVVFQRTPNFSIPARNALMSDEYSQSWKSDYSNRRAQARTKPAGILADFGSKSALDVSSHERECEFERRWASGGTNFMAAFPDLQKDLDANETAASFVRMKIKEVVKDPLLAEQLTPDDHPIGSKRICADNGYFETFNRDNVRLVNLRSRSLERILPVGVKTDDETIELDALVLATGFDALTGALSKIEIIGREGQTLQGTWKDGPKTLLGLMTAGFPNMFIVTGPGSPSVMTNVIVAIEDNVEWIANCMVRMRLADKVTIEATEEAERDWMGEVQEAAAGTLYSKAKSWYLGMNVPGKPPVFLPYVGGLPKYQRRCEVVASDGYPGFSIS